MLDAVSLDDALGSLTTSDTNDIDVFVLCEYLIDGDLLLEQVPCELHLLFGSASVHLDLEDVVLLLSEVQSIHISVNDGSNDRAVFDNSLELKVLVLCALGQLGVVLGEGLLLGIHPVLVESPEGVLGELGGPNGGQGSEASGSLDVADKTDDSDGRSLNDGNWLDGLLLVELCARSIDLSENVGHTCLKSSEGG